MPRSRVFAEAVGKDPQPGSAAMGVSGAAGPPRAAVIGWPVAHSLSPVLHRFWLREFALPGHYDALPVAPAALAKFLAGLKPRGLRGVNVTLPHKEAALALCDDIDDTARRVGSVNTLTLLPDGRLTGSNSDWAGFRAALIDAGAVERLTGRGAALVLGAGGAARAVVVALQEMGFAPITLLNRTMERAQRIAMQLGGAVRAASPKDAPRLMKDAVLLVNTTSLGMVGKPPLQLSLSPLSPTAMVADIVYTPLQTPLLQQAAQRGHITVDGLGMLMHQAVPGFCAWFAPPRPPRPGPELRAELMKVVMQRVAEI